MSSGLLKARAPERAAPKQEAGARQRRRLLARIPLRLTGRGVATLVGSIVLMVAGHLLGFALLLALGAAAFGAVVASVVISNRRPKVAVSREVYPDRVGRGGAAFARLRVHNPGSRWQAGFTAGDWVGERFRRVVVRSLLPGATANYSYELPTDTRGKHNVGPLTLDRADPLGLGRSRLTTGDTATLWVHPRTLPMRAIAGGRPRHHHEGRTTDDSLRGSLDLREVREYVVGDEVRHLHWKATARTGKLMVREYIDPNQPRFTALLDTRAAQMPAPVFEEAVDLAASLVSASALADHKCRLVTPCGVDAATTGGAPALRQLLDELCVLDRCTETTALVPGQLARAEGGSLAVVLSAITDADRASLAASANRFATVIVIVLSGQTGPSVPGVRMLAASSASAAAERWNAVMAR
jgi:uncharacterized protein (DUF58 family)